MSRTDVQGRRLCNATAKSTGEPCRAPAIAGGLICRVRGGAEGTEARAKADRLMLDELLGPALSALKTVIEDPKASDSARVRPQSQYWTDAAVRPGPDPSSLTPGSSTISTSLGPNGAGDGDLLGRTGRRGVGRPSHGPTVRVRSVPSTEWVVQAQGGPTHSRGPLTGIGRTGPNI